MEFYEVVRKRRSYRVYKTDIPEEKKVNRVLEAARLAPTWANMQGMHYIVVNDPETVKKIWKAVGQQQKFAERPLIGVHLNRARPNGHDLSSIVTLTSALRHQVVRESPSA